MQQLKLTYHQNYHKFFHHCCSLPYNWRLALHCFPFLSTDATIFISFNGVLYTLDVFCVTIFSFLLFLLLLQQTQFVRLSLPVYVDVNCIYENGIKQKKKMLDHNVAIAFDLQSCILREWWILWWKLTTMQGIFIQEVNS